MNQVPRTILIIVIIIIIHNLKLSGSEMSKSLLNLYILALYGWIKAPPPF